MWERYGLWNKSFVITSNGDLNLENPAREQIGF